jgi:hypothetical protein
MPSYLHELLLLLFRNRSGSAADLLRELDVQLPEYDEIHAESSDLNDLRPAEYRADLVLLLMRGSQKVLGVIVEVQLGRDEDKRYAWPAYIANLRARHRCKVCLLVITIEDAVARLGRKIHRSGAGDPMQTVGNRAVEHASDHSATGCPRECRARSFVGNRARANPGYSAG